jgi:hypothetical protein
MTRELLLAGMRRARRKLAHVVTAVALLAMAAAPAAAGQKGHTPNHGPTHMSYNLQYLQLQNQMQNENRQYTAVSNILKTRHDTAKNTINNIR